MRQKLKSAQSNNSTQSNDTETAHVSAQPTIMTYQGFVRGEETYENDNNCFIQQDIPNEYEEIKDINVTLS